ncbi:hypothetical protein G6F46_010827 [Rhizopus delemar]|uniref:BHLH domain-containing protein n=3 Tax=Rhizopus TaxID=4842 RepID=I1CUX5_RHIO9|nr:hypothetical protein RO3G_17062 [Rhizopus delemar RA 99-880]KAG1053637.1 hypothetical protein G6F43_004306 [Rhizopus delemar]KAG1537819.1 hypothetical protein G6F51_010144 [Rhizopus arrhizus]KAG1460002.1 hypothetical protein G6F55_004430 [Rhizopus delemar]KAG1490861.1 hypothetical protein G6F54_010422 [Rhizopus delemar]|eukprot:EIE92255.1 hypothetical protein RO3G_17062 [Rhizopus delemar RA 99-880]
MTESTFRLRNPTDYHLQQQQQQIMMDEFIYQPPLTGFLSPLLSDFDEFEMKNKIEIDLLSEGSPSEYSSVFSHPPHFIDNRNHSSDTLLSVSPQSTSSFYTQPFSAPTQMNYLATLNHTSIEDYESLQIQQQIINEKRRRRRESHNAVERRRRENINERIQELGTLLPESMLEEITNHTGNNTKPNKGAILRKSVDHIRLLQQQVTNYQERIHQLESQLASLTC